MKYSEAIRLGNMLGPQANGEFYNVRTGGMCANGSALRAIGKLDLSQNYQNFAWEHITAAWPWASEHGVRVTCPAGCSFKGPVASLVPHLNNSGSIFDHGWTREQIADWVETIEAQHEPVSQPAPVSVEV